jgi:molybdopterin-binding protein
MRLSARNVFKGRVVEVKAGPVMASVKVDIGAGNIVTALVSAEAVDGLGVVEGGPLTIIIKATDVMLAISD